eukprot:9496578-Pyramimonas_sp.AAC.1
MIKDAPRWSSPKDKMHTSERCQGEPPPKYEARAARRGDGARRACPETAGPVACPRASTPPTPCGSSGERDRSPPEVIPSQGPKLRVYTGGVYAPRPCRARVILALARCIRPPGRGHEGLYAILGPRMALAWHGGGV